MTFSRNLCAALALACLIAPETAAQTPPAAPLIRWEVTNRFRLFRRDADFERVKAAHGAAKAGSILDAEQRLNANGRGWLPPLSALCYDPAGATRIIDKTCARDRMEDGASAEINENYLNPVSHPVRLSVSGLAPGDPSRCSWTIGDRRKAQPAERACAEPVNVRIAGAAPVPVSVLIRAPNGAGRTLSADVQVRDILIVGMGDSIASGEGNPHRPVVLSDNVFCFDRLGTAEQIYLPGRGGANVRRGCPPPLVDDRAEWDRGRAGWLFTPCHLSLYGYQARAAMALAIEQEHAAVTFVPLACTGATIASGLLGPQTVLERPLINGTPAARLSTAQFTQIEALLKLGPGQKPVRRPDLILLTIGANDIKFSGLVANAITAQGPERRLMEAAGLISDPVRSRPLIKSVLKPGFANLRTRLQSVMGGTLDHVVYTVYGNPALNAGGATCPGGRKGFDVHPAFDVDGAVLRETVKFVDTEFLPALKAYAQCAQGAGCADPARQKMQFADAHAAAFADHGFCAADAAADPAFDTDCFSPGGTSFRDTVPDLDVSPLTCRQHTASAFRTYARRARWVRTANDGYFSAMTFSETLAVQGQDLHDALWGLTAGVFGGAVHPTAEGHAAMADAMLPVARAALGLSPPQLTVAR